MQESGEVFVVDRKFLKEGIARAGNPVTRLTEEEKQAREKKLKAQEERAQRKKKHEAVRRHSGLSETKRSESHNNAEEFAKSANDNFNGFDCKSANEGKDFVPPVVAPETLVVIDTSVKDKELAELKLLLEEKEEQSRRRQEDFENWKKASEAREQELRQNAQEELFAVEMRFETTMQDYVKSTSSKMQALMEEMVLKQECSQREYEELLAQTRKEQEEMQKLRAADELAEKEMREDFARRKAAEEELKMPDHEHQHESASASSQKAQAPEEDTTKNAKWHDSFNESIKYAQLNAMKHGFVVLTGVARTVEMANAVIGHPLALDRLGNNIQKKLHDGEFTESIEKLVHDPFVMDVLSKPSVGIAATFMETLLQTHFKNVEELEQTGAYGYRVPRRFEGANKPASPVPPASPQPHHNKPEPQRQEPNHTNNQPNFTNAQHRPSSPSQPETRKEVQIGAQQANNCKSSTSSTQQHSQTANESIPSSSFSPNPDTAWGKRAIEKKQQEFFKKQPDIAIESDESDAEDEKNYIEDCDLSHINFRYVRDPITGQPRKAEVFNFVQKQEESPMTPNQMFQFGRQEENLAGALDLLINTTTTKPLPQPQKPNFEKERTSASNKKKIKISIKKKPNHFFFCVFMMHMGPTKRNNVHYRAEQQQPQRPPKKPTRKSGFHPFCPPPLPPPLPPPVLNLCRDCHHEHPIYVRCLQKQKLWQRGFDFFVSGAWQNPSLQIGWEHFRCESVVDDDARNSLSFHEGMQDAQLQWNNIEQAKHRIAQDDIAQIMPLSRCNICMVQHSVEKQPAKCMDIRFRMNEIEAWKQDGDNVTLSRGQWFKTPKAWTSCALRPLPKDVAHYGQLVSRNNECSVLFSQFPKYAIKFLEHEVIIPKLSRQNYVNSSDTQSQNTTPTIPVVDDRWTSTILCSKCGLKFEFQNEAVSFHSRNMQYVDCDVNDAINTDNDECYVLKNAILFQNKAIHPLCCQTVQTTQTV